MSSTHGPDPNVIHVRDTHMRGMAAQTEANAMSSVRTRDIQAGLSSESVKKKLRRDALLAVLLFSAVIVCFLLFYLLL